MRFTLFYKNVCKRLLHDISIARMDPRTCCLG